MDVEDILTTKGTRTDPIENTTGPIAETDTEKDIEDTTRQDIISGIDVIEFDHKQVAFKFKFNKRELAIELDFDIKKMLVATFCYLFVQTYLAFIKFL